MKKLILVGLGLFATLLILFIAINLTDESPNANTQALLDRPLPPVPPEAVRGYKYVLGIQVAEGQDPTTRGEQIYSRLKHNLQVQDPAKILKAEPDERTLVTAIKIKGVPTGYISRSEFVKHREKIEEFISTRSTLLERYQHLLTLGSVGADLPPAYDTSWNFTAVLNGMRSYHLVLLGKLHAGQVAEVADGLRREFRFYSSSMQFSMSLLQTMLFTTSLKEIRSFVRGAAEENAAFRKLMTPAAQAEFQVDLDSRALLERAQQYELKVTEKLFDPKSLSEVENSFFGILISDAPLHERFAALALRFYASNNKNRILHSVHRCWEGEKTSESMVAVYPFATLATRIFCPGFESRKEKLEKSTADLRQPLLL